MVLLTAAHNVHNLYGGPPWERMVRLGEGRYVGRAREGSTRAYV